MKGHEKKSFYVSVESCRILKKAGINMQEVVRNAIDDAARNKVCPTCDRPLDLDDQFISTLDDDESFLEKYHRD